MRFKNPTNRTLTWSQGPKLVKLPRQLDPRTRKLLPEETIVEDDIYEVHPGQEIDLPDHIWKPSNYPNGERWPSVIEMKCPWLVPVNEADVPIWKANPFAEGLSTKDMSIADIRRLGKTLAEATEIYNAHQAEKAQAEAQKSQDPKPSKTK